MKRDILLYFSISLYCSVHNSFGRNNTRNVRIGPFDQTATNQDEIIGKRIVCVHTV